MITADFLSAVRDPIVFGKLLWPDVTFYKEQREIIYSFRDNDCTLVPAGNMLGKDFVAGFLAIGAFLAPQVFINPRERSHEVRGITTSVRDDHLRVLWGEIGRFVQTCCFPLDSKDGGPLIIRHRDLRKLVDGKECKISYLLGMVSEKGEGMAGHHAAHNFVIGDESSGIDNVVFTQTGTWAKRQLWQGNPNPCAPGADFFYREIKGGDILAQG